MSSTPLIPVSWGEVLDKISILEIKNERITNPAALENVRRELAALSAVTARQLPDRPGLAELRQRLRTVNEQLWKIEDAIRDKERAKEFDARFIALARAVYVTNDERARIKRELNALTASGLVEEKSYQAY